MACPECGYSEEVYNEDTKLWECLDCAWLYFVPIDNNMELGGLDDREKKVF